MDVLQGTVALLADFDPEKHDDSKEANLKRASRLIAVLPTVVAFWDRIRKNQPPIEPNAKLNRAANFLYMLLAKSQMRRRLRILTPAWFCMLNTRLMPLLLRQGSLLQRGLTCTLRSALLSGHFQANCTAARICRLCGTSLKSTIQPKLKLGLKRNLTTMNASWAWVTQFTKPWIPERICCGTSLRNLHGEQASRNGT